MPLQFLIYRPAYFYRLTFSYSLDLNWPPKPRAFGRWLGIVKCDLAERLKAGHRGWDQKVCTCLSDSSLLCVLAVTWAAFLCSRSFYHGISGFDIDQNFKHWEPKQTSPPLNGGCSDTVSKWRESDSDTYKCCNHLEECHQKTIGILGGTESMSDFEDNWFCYATQFFINTVYVICFFW